MAVELGCGDDRRLLQADRADEAFQPLVVGSPCVDAEPRQARDDVDSPRLDVDVTDGGNGAVDRERRLADAQDLGGCGDEGVVALVHRDVPACPARPWQVFSPRAYAAIPVTTASGAPAASRRGPCSWCSSTKAPGSAPRATRPREPAQPRSSSRKATTPSVRACLPRPSTASSAPSTPSGPSRRPAFGHRVEVRARPHLGQLGQLTAEPAHEVPGLVDLDVQSGRLHPPRGEPVRLVLLGGKPHPVRAWPATDAIDLVETLLQPAGHAPYDRSKSAAWPCPTPTQSVASP